MVSVTSLMNALFTAFKILPAILQQLLNQDYVCDNVRSSDLSSPFVPRLYGFMFVSLWVTGRMSAAVSRCHTLNSGCLSVVVFAACKKMRTAEPL